MKSFACTVYIAVNGDIVQELHGDRVYVQDYWVTLHQDSEPGKSKKIMKIPRDKVLYTEKEKDTQ